MKMFERGNGVMLFPEPCIMLQSDISAEPGGPVNWWLPCWWASERNESRSGVPISCSCSDAWSDSPASHRTSFDVFFTTGPLVRLGRRVGGEPAEFVPVPLHLPGGQQVPDLQVTIAVVGRDILFRHQTGTSSRPLPWG